MTSVDRLTFDECFDGQAKRGLHSVDDAFQDGFQLAGEAAGDADRAAQRGLSRNRTQGRLHLHQVRLMYGNLNEEEGGERSSRQLQSSR